MNIKDVFKGSAFLTIVYLARRPDNLVGRLSELKNDILQETGWGAPRVPGRCQTLTTGCQVAPRSDCTVFVQLPMGILAV